MVAKSQPNSKRIRKRNCPPENFCFNKKAWGRQMVNQKIQNGPLEIVKRRIFLKEKISPLPPSSLIRQTCRASQTKTPAPIKEIR